MVIFFYSKALIVRELGIFLFESFTADGWWLCGNSKLVWWVFLAKWLGRCVSVRTATGIRVTGGLTRWVCWARSVIRHDGSNAFFVVDKRDEFVARLIVLNVMGLTIIVVGFEEHKLRVMGLLRVTYTFWDVKRELDPSLFVSD